MKPKGYDVVNEAGEIVKIIAKEKEIVILGVISYLNFEGDNVREFLKPTGPVRISWETLQAIKEDIKKK